MILIFASEWRTTPKLCYNVRVMDEHIEINPLVCLGNPVIRGTRVLVSQILGALAGGDSVDTVLEDYPSISSEDVYAALRFGGSLASFVVALHQPSRAAILTRLEWFFATIPPPYRDKAFIIRDYSCRIKGA